MQALILAAGMGKRLGKFTRDCTKCMVEVAGKKLIDHTIEAFINVGIYRVVVVIGYEGQKLKNYLIQRGDKIDWVFIQNDDFACTNNIYSLYLAKDELEKDDTILMESDLIYDDVLLKKLIKAPFENMVTVAKYEQWMDGTVVLLNEEGCIAEFVEKADFRFADADKYYKTVNIYKFSQAFLHNQYIPFLEAYIRAYGKNQYYELVLKILAHVRYSELKALPVGDCNWYEIDDEQDLQIANAIFSEDDKQFSTYDHQFGGFWRFPKLKDFCYLVNPYYPPQKMLDHMKYFYDTLLRGYPSGLETQNLNAGRMFQVDSRYLLTGNGAAELIYALGKTMQGRLLVQVPVFNEYVRCFQNCEIIKLHSSEYDYNIPVEVIIQNIGRVDAVVMVNPDNPSGNLISYEDLIQVVKICKRQNKLCIIDESFVDFAEKGKRFTLLEDSVLDDFRNLIVVKSISKSYGVPGLRLGVMASSNNDILDRIKQEMPIWNINSFAEYFLQIHNLYEKDYIVACDQIARQRIRMIERLAQNKLIKVYPSQANYIMCKLLGQMSAKELANRLIKEYGILIKDLSSKEGIEERQYVRVAVKNQQENDLLIKAVNEELR